MIFKRNFQQFSVVNNRIFLFYNKYDEIIIYKKVYYLIDN